MKQLLSILSLSTAVLLTACGGGAGSPQAPQTPAQAPKRTDLGYTYACATNYGSQAQQLAETGDQINLWAECQYGGEQAAVQAILAAHRYTALDISPQLYATAVISVKPYVTGLTLKPTAESELRSFFTLLHNANALQYVHMLYPADEPNITMVNPQDLFSGIAVVRRVSAEFAELTGVKLGVVYADPTMVGKTVADVNNLIGIDEYDYIGIDSYGRGADILKPGDIYSALLQRISARQQLLLLPGGNYGQDPKPFVDYAEATPQVAGIIAWTWADDNSYTENPTAVTKGIRSYPDQKAAYTQAGLSIVNHN